MNSIRRGLRWAAAWLLVAAIVAPAASFASQPKLVTARAGILIDRSSGKILWENNADVALPPASTTKVVTATLALQSGDLDRTVRVSRRAAAEPPSNIRLRPGWELSLEDLVYAILLNSANDASVVIAEGLSGSVEAFAARMNVHAYAVGARATHFLNPNGLPDDGHVASARDLALMFDHALEIPAFREVLETQARTIRTADTARRKISLRSKNRLLKDYRYRVIGKTGWTRAAKKCFVGSATHGDREILVAMLGSDDLWGDLRRLVEYGFEGVPQPVPRSQRLFFAAASDDDTRAAGDTDDVQRAPGGRFYVRVATFRGESYAARLKSEMRADGFPADIFRIVRNGRSLYRVSVGGYPSRSSAAQVQRRIERQNPKLKTLLVKS